VRSQVQPMTRAELLGLPVSTDLVTAGRAFGVGRTKAHRMARAGEFPVPVLRLGASYRVRTADLLTLLGIEPAKHGDDPGGTPDSVLVGGTTTP